MRRRWLTLTAAALLAVACVASACSAFREIVIAVPGHLDIVDAGLGEISGQSSGYGRIDMTLDGLDSGTIKGIDSTRVTDWRIPIEPLTDGVHSIQARGARSPFISDEVVFAVSSNPFAIGFLPDRLPPHPGLTLDRSVSSVSLAIFGADRPDQVEVRLSIADSAGLILVSDPPELLPPSGLGTPVAAHTSVPIAVRFPVATPPGIHYVRVRADGPAGTEPQSALLTVAVPDPPSRTPTPPFEPRAVNYRVVSTLRGNQSGEGSGRARWRVTFECTDGRCDADVRNGGPRGGQSFVARYRADTRSWAFEGAQPIPNSNCRQLFSGTIQPLRWDERGPVRFDYRWVWKLRCRDGRTSTLQRWEGTGERA
jgi:hypothetical protein